MHVCRWCTHYHLSILGFVCLLNIITAPEGKQVYDKKRSCFFAIKSDKIARHVEQMQGDEEEIQARSKHPANAPERLQQFEKLCRMATLIPTVKF